jgi:DNA-binding NarL/FixJ family response regulator
MPVKVLIFEDNRSLREGLEQLLASAGGIEVCGAFADAREGGRLAKAHAPDVILMDIDMPGVTGIEALKEIKSALPATQIVMLTVFDDDKNIFESIKAGASGYLLKKTPPAKIIDAVRDVAAGGSPMSSSVARQVLQMFSKGAQPSGGYTDLSEREKEVLTLLVNGHSYKMVAASLFISIDTVRSHIKNIYDKLHVNSKSEAVAKAIRDNIV